MVGIRVQKKNFGTFEDENGAQTHYRVYSCWSDDCGKTWTAPKRLTDKDGKELFFTPPHLIQLKNGAVVMTGSSRNFVAGQRVILSYDDGESWDELFVLCDKVRDRMDDEGKAVGYLCGDVGYPATCVTADGNLLTVYYQAYTGDKFSSFLYSKWSLQ